MKTNKSTNTVFLGWLLRIVAVVALMAPLVGPLPVTQNAQAATPPTYVAAGVVDFTDALPTLTAVDPLAWGISGDVLPARPFLYSVDATGITITRFNDNQVVGTWPWPTDVIYTVMPDGSFMGIDPPAWEPVAMTVSYPTEPELANRVKEIPDLTPPWTFVYVVMEHSGYRWNSSTGSLRDTLEPTTDAATESAMLIQIDVSDPSFSTSRDPVAPSGPHIAAAILGHGAGQPVYDRSNGNIYVGNLPSTSLPAGLTSFVSVIRRIPPEVAAEEAEIPGISKPVIRCGPQHPETGIPVNRPQAYACYDPSGVHPIDDNEHVGASGAFEWEFRNLPAWLTAHLGTMDTDGIIRGSDGILYGTPTETGEWWAEARVHNIDDPYGVFSDWHPIRLLVTPDAEYLPIKAQFAAGVPVAYQLEGEGSCALTGAPAWVEVTTVTNGCVVMGTAPLDGEHYNFTMPGFTVAGYPSLSLEFSGNVFGEYSFVPLPEGVGISGMAWHQVSKVTDPSTEPPVLSLEYIGVDPNTGQLWQILAPPGQPQPPNERPPETELTLDVVSAEGAPLGGSGFGEVAVEADRDIYVAAGGEVIKVSDGIASNIALSFTPFSLSLDSDLRTAIPGVEEGQFDNGVLWAAGAGGVAVIDTDAEAVAQSFAISGASSVSVDFPTRYAYVANGTPSIAIFAPTSDGTNADPRPPVEPRIWSSEEITWNFETASVSEPFKVMATGDLPMTLVLEGELPHGITFVDNGDGTATVSGVPHSTSTQGVCSGTESEGDLEGGDVCGGFAFSLTATNDYGEYAQALGMDVNVLPTIDNPNTATFYADSASSFTVFGTGIPDPIFYTWDEATLEAAGVQLVDNENGTASIVGTPTTLGTFVFDIQATTGFPEELEPLQEFTLIVAEGPQAPEINSFDTATWEVIGAPFGPDPFAVASIGSPTPALSVVTAEGQSGLPPSVTFIDNGDSTATFGAACQVTWPGMDPSCLGLLTDEAEGAWTFTIHAENSGGTADQAFTLNVEVATSIMIPGPDAPANLAFSYTPGGPMPPAQTFSVGTLGDTLLYAAVTTADWLEATPESGSVPGGLTVSVDPTGLAPGTYTGTVLVTSAGTEGPFATALVTLIVVDTSLAGELGIFPSVLNFAYNVNEGILPPAQSLLVMSGGVPLEYTVSTGDAKWLSVAPVSGTAPDVFSVSVDPRVGVGMHIANLTIEAPGALYGSETQVIPVTLLKTAGDSDLIQVMFDVGSGPEGLAANLTTHNLFITSSNAAAEAAEAGEAIIPAVEGPGPPDPPLVFHINPLDQTLVSQIVVHGEAEYIGVNSTTGLAYQASQATGELAVIDGSTNTVLTFIDLTLNGDPQSPYQVAIDEAQNIIYVGAKSPEPEPDGLIPDEDGKYGCKAIQELPSDEVPEGEDPELDCWHPGPVIVIDGETNEVVSHFLAGDDPEGVVFAAATGKVYASNEDDGNITVAQGAVRNSDGSITPPQVLGTIIRGSLDTKWQLECDLETNYCGERENLEMWLWPERSFCHGTDDEAEEADKMAVDPDGNVYIIDDRYRVAKIDGTTDAVVEVIEIDGYDCEATVPDDSNVVFKNTANNIAYMPLGQGKLYVTSEQNTLTLITWKKKGKDLLTNLTTLTLPAAAELDAITTDPEYNQVYITDEELASLWILKGACANGVGVHCTQ